MDGKLEVACMAPDKPLGIVPRWMYSAELGIPLVRWPHTRLRSARKSPADVNGLQEEQPTQQAVRDLNPTTSLRHRSRICIHFKKGLYLL